MLKKVIAYLRKSTPGDIKQVSSLWDQQDWCLEKIQELWNYSVLWSDGKFYTENIENHFFSEAISAKEKWTRKKFSQMIQLVKKHPIDTLYVRYIDRLARNRSDRNKIIELLEEGHIQQIVTGSKTYRNNNDDILVLESKLLFAEQENEEKSIKAKDAYERDLKKWIRNTKFPYGYEGLWYWRVKIDKDSAEHIKVVFSLKKQWFNNADIWREILKQGKQKVSNNFVANTLKNPVYCGKMKWHDGVMIDIKNPWFKPIIEYSEWLDIQSLLKNGTKKASQISKNKKQEENRGYFSNILVDFYWNKLQYDKWYYKTSSYHAKKYKQEWKKLTNISQALVISELDNLIKDILLPIEFYIIIWKTFSEQSSLFYKNKDGEKYHISKEIENEEKIIQHLIEASIRSPNMEKRYTKMIREHEENIEKLEQELEEYNQSPDEYIEFQQKLKTLFMNFHAVFSELSTFEKVCIIEGMDIKIQCSLDKVLSLKSGKFKVVIPPKIKTLWKNTPIIVSSICESPYIAMSYKRFLLPHKWIAA